MCYPVCGMVHINDPLLLIENNISCSLSLCEWFFTIFLTPYNRKKNLFSAPLNKYELMFIESLRLELHTEMSFFKFSN